MASLPSRLIGGLGTLLRRVSGRRRTSLTLPYPWSPILYIYDHEPSIQYLRTHTVILTDTQHENAVDVLAILEDTHTTGRYRMIEDPRSLPLTYSHLRNLDFYFTDPAGAVIGAAVEGGGTTASDITGHASIFMFLDFEDEDQMTISAPPQLLTEIIASNNPALEFQPSSGSGIAYGDWIHKSARLCGRRLGPTARR